MDGIIIKYLKGEATEKEKKQLLEWLRQNPENRKTLAQLRDIWLSSEEACAIGSDDLKVAFQRFLTSVKREEEVRWKKSYRFYLNIAASVALLLVCSVGGYWVGHTRTSKIQTAETLIMNQVIMGKDSKGSFSLPDGTVVWLNANSRLIYPEKFSADSRLVKLEGEGYFNVTKNEKKPFLVETDGMTVNVLGTCFDVRNYKEKHISETTLLSGKVEVSLPGVSGKITLSPNQKIHRHKETGAFEVEVVDAKKQIIWIKEKLVFTNEKLSDILDKMEYWYGIEIDCQKGVPMEQRLSLTIRKESKDEILKLLSLIAPVSYTVNDDQVTIRKK